MVYVDLSTNTILSFVALLLTTLHELTTVPNDVNNIQDELTGFYLALEIYAFPMEPSTHQWMIQCCEACMNMYHAIVHSEEWYALCSVTTRFIIIGRMILQVEFYWLLL